MNNENCKVCYLIKIDSYNNNNKYYQMTHVSGEPYFIAKYGRVGSSGMQKKYPIISWDKVLHEKLENGYVQREVSFVAENKEKKYSEITNYFVADLVKRLKEWSSNVIKEEYDIKVSLVTSSMLEEAKSLIEKMSQENNLTVFNQLLVKLFSVVPRRIEGHVSDKLARTEKDFSSIILRENELLNIMKGEVKLNLLNETYKNKTILDALEIEIEPVTEKEEDEILSHLHYDTRMLYKAGYKIINRKSEKKFQEYCENEMITNIQYLYHGSRNENFWNIISNGLYLNPIAPINGKMFGKGIYFANLSKKSVKYTSLKGALYTGWTSNTGFLSIFKVAVGKSLDIYEWSPDMSQYTEKTIKETGNNSVFAHKGKSLINDEIVIYNEAAASIQYLIELEK